MTLSEAAGRRPCGEGRVAVRPPQERPRERLARLGARALADDELLALLLRTGDRARDAEALARSVLETIGGVDALSGALLSQLEAVPGLGPAKATSLLAAAELARRMIEEPIERGRPIGSPADVQNHFSPRLTSAKRESFCVLILDGRHRLILEEEVSTGTLTASLVHPREVFRSAIQAAAAALVLVHNHPSGNPLPSAEDRIVTDRLCAVGKLVGITVVDHVIVAESGYFSFRESGQLGDVIGCGTSDARHLGGSMRPEAAKSATPGE